MKATQFFVWAAAGVFGVLAHAQTPGEVFNLGAGFSVSKCDLTTVNQGTEFSCDDVAPAEYKSVPVVLSVCSAMDAKGIVSCQGSWFSSNVVDSVRYQGAVTVIKNVDPTGNATYSLIGDVWDSTSNGGSTAGMSLAGKVPTDSATLLGNFNTSKTDANLGYFGRLLMGPPSASAQIPKNLHPILKH